MPVAPSFKGKLTRTTALDSRLVHGARATSWFVLILSFNVHETRVVECQGHDFSILFPFPPATGLCDILSDRLQINTNVK